MTAYRTDSARLISAMANAAGSFQNPFTGFGTGRDPLSHTQVVAQPELSDIELALLYEQTHVIQKIAYLYPLESADHWLKFSIGRERKYGSYGMADADLQGYLNDRVDREGNAEASISQSDLPLLFFDGSLNGRMFGRSHLLLGIDDGRDWDEPVNPETIKSLRWIEPLYHFELQVENGGRGIGVTPRFYRLVRYSARDRDSEMSDTLPSHALIHHSRVITFNGVYLTKYSMMRRSGRSLSVLQGVWRALARVQQSMDASAYLLQTASMFSYGLRGLSQIEDATMKQVIQDRFESIMMSLSILKGLPHDADQETIGFASRQFGGIDKLLQIIIDQLALECDVPRFKVLEISNQGGLNNNKGESERFLWSQVLDSWRSRNWKSPFAYLGKIAMLAKDSPTRGRPIKDLGVEVPSSHQFTPQEELEMRKAHLEAMSIAKSNGFLNEYEVRMSTYGAAQWSFNITLDDRVTERLNEAVDNPPDEQQSPVAGQDPAAIPNSETAAPDETKLPQFDRADQSSDRAEVTNASALAMLLDVLDDHATGVRRVFNVTVDGSGVFRGNAEIPVPGNPSQFLSWKIDPNGAIGYRGVDAARSDSWREDAGVAKKSGKKLNCKAGNIQCGGKCQGASMNCFVGMSPEQRTKAQSALRLAKKGEPVTKGEKAGKTTAPQPATAKSSPKKTAPLQQPSPVVKPPTIPSAKAIATTEQERKDYAKGLEGMSQNDRDWRKFTIKDSRKFVKKVGGPPPHAEEVAALTGYSSLYYGALNARLRGDDASFSDVWKKRADQEIKLATAAIDALPKHDGIVYRGTNLPKAIADQYKKGGVVREKAFTSTSTNVDVAKTFSQGGDGVPVVYTIKSKNGRSVRDLSAVKSEEEILFRPSTQFKVLDVEDRNGVRHVYMEES